MTIETANAPEIAKDEIVEGVNDNPNPPAAAAPEPAAREAAQPEAQEAEKPQVPPDARAEIAARFKRQRRDEEGAPHEPDDFQTPPFLQREAQAEPEPQQAAHEAASSSQDAGKAPAAPEQFTLKVRGNEMKVTRDQLIKEAGLEAEEAAHVPPSALIKLAQKNIALSSYIDEARENATEMRRAARSQPQHQEAGEAADPDTDETSDTQLDPELVQVVEKIQYGDPTEAAKALAEAVSKVTQKQQAQQHAPRHQREVDEAFAAFSQANADLLDDEDASDLVFSAVMREMKADLIKAGVPQDRVESMIRTPEQASQAYVAARLNGMEVRTPKDILDAAAARARRFVPGQARTTQQPAPQPPGIDRTAAKRALTQQPTRDNAQPFLVAQQAQERTRSSVVQNMRKARGQA